MSWDALSIESGGDDWLDAGRRAPNPEAAALCCVLCFRREGGSNHAFQLYHSLLFYQAIGSSCQRKLGCGPCWISMLASLLFAYRDLSSRSLRPSASTKRGYQFKDVAVSDNPLQIARSRPCDLQPIHQIGSVLFWPRDRLTDKMTFESNSLSPVIASKIYGVMNFLAHAISGRKGSSCPCVSCVRGPRE